MTLTADTDLELARDQILRNHGDEIRLVDGKIPGEFDYATLPVLTPVWDKLNAISGETSPAVGKTHEDLYDRLKRADLAALRGAGLMNDIPPEGIHMIGRGSGVFMDVRHADTIAEVVMAAGFGFSEGRMADFGSSVGRTAKAMAVAFPMVDWLAIEPMVKSVAWGQANVPDVTFLTMDRTPPLPFEDAALDGLYAKSVWTHYGLDVARGWLEDCARIVRPGGFVAISTHGFHDLVARLSGGKPPNLDRLAGTPRLEEFLLACHDGMVTRGCYHIPYSAYAAMGVSWGLTFMSKRYLLDEIVPSTLILKSHAIGALGGRQDLFVFEVR